MEARPCGWNEKENLSWWRRDSAALTNDNDRFFRKGLLGVFGRNCN